MVCVAYRIILVIVLSISGSLLSLPMPADLESFSIQKTRGYADYGAACSWQAIPQKKIFFYAKSKPYYEFTNFYPSPITIDAVVWPTSEHYYQAMKFPHDAHIQTMIQKAATPRAAFDIARKHQQTVRADWWSVNVSIMKRAVWEKFTQHGTLLMKLVATGAAVLIEDAGDNDAFYGAGADYTGDNYLGRILMLERTYLQRSLMLVAAQQTGMLSSLITQPQRTRWQRFKNWLSSFFAKRVA